MTVAELLKLVLQGDVAALLLIVIITGMKGMWFFRWYVEELRRDRDEWKEAARNGTYLAARAVETIERAADVGKA